MCLWFRSYGKKTQNTETCLVLLSVCSESRFSFLFWARGSSEKHIEMIICVRWPDATDRALRDYAEKCCCISLSAASRPNLSAWPPYRSVMALITKTSHTVWICTRRVSAIMRTICSCPDIQSEETQYSFLWLSFFHCVSLSLPFLRFSFPSPMPSFSLSHLRAR